MGGNHKNISIGAASGVAVIAKTIRPGKKRAEVSRQESEVRRRRTRLRLKATPRQAEIRRQETDC